MHCPIAESKKTKYFLALGIQYVALPRFIIEGSLQSSVVRNTGPLMWRPLFEIKRRSGCGSLLFDLQEEFKSMKSSNTRRDFLRTSAIVGTGEKSSDEQ